jgi:hypothetical protein
MERPLRELNPMWHEKAGEKVGILFDCPACGNGPEGKLACMLHVQWASPWRVNQHLWTKAGDSFDNLTLSPSIDATMGGCKFHGWIQDGIVRW